MNVTENYLSKIYGNPASLRELEKVAEFLYNNMIYFVGIPQLILNTTVFSLILLYKQRARASSCNR